MTISQWSAAPDDEFDCRECGKDLHRSAFYSHPRTGQVKQPYKECCKARRRRRYSQDEVISKAREANWERYGVTPTEYERIRKEQANLCAICGQEETSTPKYGTRHILAIDHDHKTRRVRALLCRNCNTVLGFIEKNFPRRPPGL
ncbi:endonuclease domain-containing protein [Streptomyces rapamycinicus]|uniref:endonuclease domain-containing protein n=1 Tax=Streptomyces rapamycinicus TaxID=1226757 RepID=UPI000EF7B870|nr:endonuclease VII domain-containing protein [Streptomyces rapamycinicus]UTP32142.1 endonuclease VII domain-containing protein [Streptomyces rapamycinicus NRRL 5491]